MSLRPADPLDGMLAGARPGLPVSDYLGGDATGRLAKDYQRKDGEQEIPTRVTLSVRMETPGLVVLADLWDKGWQAYLNGQRVPILRTNHAIRGVVVPAGSGTLEFRYAPASFAWGLRLSALAAVVLLVWLGIALRKHRSAEG